jgi:hypothetical protein
VSVVIACYNRCLVCMRITTHEICHDHSRALGHRWPDMVQDDPTDPDTGYDFPAWVCERGYPAEPEVCEDAECPQLKADWQ